MLLTAGADVLLPLVDGHLCLGRDNVELFVIFGTDGLELCAVVGADLRRQRQLVQHFFSRDMSRDADAGLFEALVRCELDGVFVFGLSGWCLRCSVRNTR